MESDDDLLVLIWKTGDDVVMTGEEIGDISRRARHFLEKDGNREPSRAAMKENCDSPSRRFLGR